MNVKLANFRPYHSITHPLGIPKQPQNTIQLDTGPEHLPDTCTYFFARVRGAVHATNTGHTMRQWRYLCAHHDQLPPPSRPWAARTPSGATMGAPRRARVRRCTGPFHSARASTLANAPRAALLPPTTPQRPPHAPSPRRRHTRARPRPQWPLWSMCSDLRARKYARKQ